MTVTATALRDLHRIHRQLADIRDRLTRGPKQVAAGEANLARLKTTWDEAQETVKQARVASNQKQHQLDENEGHIADLKRKLNGASSNREYQALLEQIAADEMANSVLQDEILESFDKIEELDSSCVQCEKAHAGAQEQLQALTTKVQAEKEMLESECARLETELAEAEKVLPGDFRADYDRIAKVRGEDAMAVVAEGESCDGCYTMITPQMYDFLLQSKPVFCKSCGRLLYLPEDTKVGS